MNAHTPIASSMNQRLPEGRDALLVAIDHADELFARARSIAVYDLASVMRHEAYLHLADDVEPAALERAVKCCRHLALAAMELQRLEVRGGI
jgi:hypothetical protein